MGEDRAVSTSLFKQAASDWRSITASKEIDYENLSEEHNDDLSNFLVQMMVPMRAILRCEEVISPFVAEL